MIKKFCIGLIEIYQKYISVNLKHSCKYYPSCSEYTKNAIDKYGTVKGIILGIKRILKCNPFSKGGYDPLK